MNFRPFTFLLLLVATVATFSWNVDADDGDKPVVKRRVVSVQVDPDADADKPQVDIFVVPEGTPEELFEFINKVKQAVPEERTKEAIISHLQRQVTAVIDAADAVLKQEISEEDAVRAVEEKFQGVSVLDRFDDSVPPRLPALARSLAGDERPGVARVAGLQLLQVDASDALQGSPADQQAIVEKLFGWLDEYGLDYRIASLIGSYGEALQHDNPTLAATTLMKLGTGMKESGDPRMVAQAEAILGTARFLNLPGNFLELDGVNAAGQEFDWAAYRGKVVLVDFWATWCGPCRAEVPNVVRNLEKYGRKGFAVVGINLDRERAAFDEYMEEADLPWENIMPDEEGNSPMAVRYGITGIPTVILVDQEGKVISTEARGRELGRLLAGILGPVDDDEEQDKPSRKPSKRKKR